MCLGVPAKIIAINDQENGLALAETSGVQREINIAMLAVQGQDIKALIGQCVVLHVGFAMALIDEEEALSTLALLQQIEKEL